MRVLVTGGLGYIGSNTVAMLIDKGHDVIVIDDWSNVSLTNVKNMESLFPNLASYVYHLGNYDSIFLEHICRYKFDAIIHFAGKKAVGESVENPLSYYEWNLKSTLEVLEIAKRTGCPRLIFSSSASVYGDSESICREKDTKENPVNPYAASKLMCERIIKDSLPNSVFLRYFNPIGSGYRNLLGDSPKGIPNNLLPYVTKVAKAKLECLNVFGTDWPTEDGTCVRDYIHVSDLAETHIRVMESNKFDSIGVMNVGTGRGYSVFEIIDTFEDVNHITLPYKNAPRREGDVATLIADTYKMESILNWKPTRTLEDMLLSAWSYEYDIKE